MTNAHAKLRKREKTKTEFSAPAVAPEDVDRIVGQHLIGADMGLVFDHKKSHGSWLVDGKTGREYLDFFTMFATSPIGYNHPEMNSPRFREYLAESALNQATLSDLKSVQYADFVKTFERVAGKPYLPHLFLIDGGTLGVENAMKAAFDWKTGKNAEAGVYEDGEPKRGNQIAHFKDAFHGRSGYALQCTNTASKVKYEGLPMFGLPGPLEAFAEACPSILEPRKWPRITNPKIVYPAEERMEEIVKAECEAMGQLEHAYASRPGSLAAILIEPIQAEGGDNHFRPEFFRKLRTFTQEHDLLLIVDEVQAGLGLTGKMWAHEHYGIEPDIVAMGKKLQTAGAMGGGRLSEVPDGYNAFRTPGRMDSTWGGNETSMARAAQMLRIIEKEKMVENAAAVGDYLLEGLTDIESGSGGIYAARGRGLMIAFDLASPEERDAMYSRLLDDGLLALKCGAQSIRFRPPLNLSREEADYGLEIIKRNLPEGG